MNSEEVYATLSRMAPRLMLVWGSTILTPRILSTAQKSINLHFGYCPHYRGALANQHAVLKGDLDRIGATIHYINGKADAGDMLAVIPADRSKKPQDLFCELNDRARERYVEISHRLYDGEMLPAEPQHHIKSNTLLLKDWTPRVRFEVSDRMLRWERERCYDK